MEGEEKPAVEGDVKETPETPPPPAPQEAPGQPAPPPPPEGTAPPPEGEPKEEKPVKEKKPKKKPPMKMLIFDRWDITEVVVHDAGLSHYINLTPIVIPHTGGRYASKPFGKAKTNIVERFINNMMRTEVYTGKKSKAYKAVRMAMESIEKKAKANPIQVMVDALEKAAPREEVTRLKYGGISVPKAVDTSSYRRVNISIKNICVGVVKSSRGSKKRIEQVLADELVSASRGDVNSFAISKKGEVERVASSAR